MSPAFTHAWNCASVGALSLPLNPPIAMTARPLPICSGAALPAPLVAAAHRVVVLSSSATSALFEVEPSPPNPPPPGPPCDDATGPALGMLPVCGWLAVDTAYAVEPPAPARTAASTATTASLPTYS